MVKLILKELAERDELLLHYPTQIEAQDAYLYLDTETGVAWAAPDYEIGGAVPMRVWEGKILRWRIPVMTARVANDEIKAFVSRMEVMLEAAEVGNTDKVMAMYQWIEDDIDELWESDSFGGIVDVWDWIGDRDRYKGMPDDELEREARSMELEAEAQDILVDGGILQAITRIRDDAQEEK